MGFGNRAEYIAPPLPRHYSHELVSDPTNEEGYVVKERALEGVESAYNANSHTNRGKLRHEQVFSTDGKENFGLFGDGRIKADKAASLGQYVQKDPNVYSKKSVQNNVEQWKQETESMDYMYETIKMNAPIGEEMPDILPKYNIFGKNCQDFACAARGTKSLLSMPTKPKTLLSK